MSLAALELFVHLPSDLLPVDLVAIEVHVPEALAIEEWPIAALPPGWDSVATPPAVQAMGASWLASGRTPLLRVPSAIVRQEWNVLINPAHPDARGLRLEPPAPFNFDPRMRKR